MVLSYNATVPAPSCYDQPPPAACPSYTAACAWPVVAGQLWSRAAIYKLVVAHELRAGYRFDSVLFTRPDLAVVVPFQPPCMQPHGNGTAFADWMVWLPRSALHGAFEAASDAFAQCRVKFGEGVMAHQASHIAHRCDPLP